jgi:hypothetical protein
MRDLVSGALEAVGYEVFRAENARELASHVHEQGLLSANVVLLVLDAELAAQCAVPISAATTLRHQLGLPPVRLVLVYEWGELGLIERPDVSYCLPIAVLEKPFEVAELKDIAEMTSLESSRAHVP